MEMQTTLLGVKLADQMRSDQHSIEMTGVCHPDVGMGVPGCCQSVDQAFQAMQEELYLSET